MTGFRLPLTHETLFTHGDHQLDWGFAGETLTVAILAAAVALTRNRHRHA